MTMTLATYKTDHLAWMFAHGFAPSWIVAGDIPAYGKGSRYAYSLLEGDTVLACFGIVEFWDGRGEIWAILNQKRRKNFIHVHHVVRNFLKACPVKRVEATVPHDFENGHRWARALGFRVEAGHMRAYFPDGKAAVLYARVS